MKNLKQYIEEKLFHQQVYEKLIVNKDYNTYQYYPATWKELRQIIEQRFEERGPGTKQEPIDFNDIDVSGMTTFFDESSYNGMFATMQYEYIDMSDWDVSKVENMGFMFHHCSNLKSVGDLSKWDVSKVENMFSMFDECNNLKSIGNISNWDVSKVENMGFMFSCCEKLESIGDLSDWNISNVRTISCMFYICKNLKSVGDLNSWNVSNVKRNRMENMFTDSGITNTPDWYEE